MMSRGKFCGVTHLLTAPRGLAVLLVAAINSEAAPTIHVIKNAVNAKRGPGGVPASFEVVANQVFGPQTRNAKRANIPVSVRAAALAAMENNIQKPQAICPAPVI